MERAPGGEDRWIIHEISSFNVPVKRRSFPKEASEAKKEALDITLSFALSLHKTSPLSFNTSALFVLFQDSSSDSSKTDAMAASRQLPSSIVA